MKLKDKIKRKLLMPFWLFLRQGITPKKLAVTIALGIVIGAFPVIGLTTALCAVCALLFRLNIAILQFVNYLSYPIQILSLIPLYKFGSFIFQDPPIHLNYEELKAKISQDFSGTIMELSQAILHGIVAWLIISPIATLFIFLLVYPLLRNLKLPVEKLEHSQD